MTNSLEQRIAKLERQVELLVSPQRLGVKAAALYVGLAPKTLRNRISRDDGTFPRPRRDGGKVLFKVSDLDAYLRAQE